MKTYRLMSCSATALGLAVTATSFAQTSGTSPAALEQIVVTARRVEENMQDVPVAISAISEQVLQRQHIVNVDEIRFAAPSFQMTPSVNGAAIPGLSIRGQRAARELIGQDPSVAVYVNEVVQTRPAGLNATLYDLQSVQVLAGPQGTLFGKNTTGGAVLLTPQRPKDVFGASIDTTFGNYDDKEVIGTLNIPFGSKVALRVAGNLAKHSGYDTNLTTGQKLADADSTSFRASLLIKPTDDFDTLTVVDGYDAETNGTIPHGLYLKPGSLVDTASRGAAAAAYNRLQSEGLLAVESDAIGYEKSRNYGASNVSTWKLSPNYTLKNIAGYRQVRSYFVNDFDASPAPLLSPSPQLSEAQWYSEELQVQATHDRFDWIAGGYFYHELGVDHGFTANFGTLNISGGEGRSTSYSGFAQGTMKFDEWVSGLSLTAGLRYTVDKREVTAQDMTFPNGVPTCNVHAPSSTVGVNGPTLPASNCARTDDKTFSEPTYNVSLNWKATADTLLYLATRRGYRAGGFNVRAKSSTPNPAADAPEGEFTPFKPEIVRDVEIGLKSDWTLGSMPARTNIALYHQWYSDIQRNVTFTAVVNGTPLVTSAIFNAAKAQISGVDFQGTILLLPSLELSVNYAWVDASYDSFSSGGVDHSDDKFSDVPDHSGSVTGTYSLPFDKSSVGDVSLSLTYYRQTGFQMADVNENPHSRAEGYGLLNARVQWNGMFGTNFDAALFGKNLSDERYIASGTSSQASVGYAWGYPGPPRTYGVQLRYTF